ncbi:hypothetical protein EON79_10995 [bacterium]|nr:MAG: hypothetical protein EON79_10995 [bacterium]
MRRRAQEVTEERGRAKGATRLAVILALIILGAFAVQLIPKSFPKTEALAKREFSAWLVREKGAKSVDPPKVRLLSSAPGSVGRFGGIQEGAAVYSVEARFVDRSGQRRRALGEADVSPSGGDFEKVSIDASKVVIR